MSFHQDQADRRDGLAEALEIGRDQLAQLGPDTQAKLDQELAEVAAHFAAHGVPLTPDTRRAFFLGLGWAQAELVNPDHLQKLPCLSNHSIFLLGIGVGIHDGGR